MPLATAAAKDQGKVPSTSISRSGTPAAARMPATVRSSVHSAAVSPRSGWSGRSNIHRPSVPAGTKTSMSSPSRTMCKAYRSAVMCRARSARNTVLRWAPSSPRIWTSSPARRRTVLSAPSAPTTQRASMVSSAPSAACARTVTPSSCWTSSCDADPEPDLPAELEQMREQHRLQVVLGRYGEVGRAHPGEHLGCGGRDGELLQHRSGQDGLDRAGDLEVLGAGADLVLEPPGTHQLHGARAEAGGLREDRGAGVPVHDQDAGTGTGGGESSGQAGGAGADDEDVVAGVGDGSSHASSVGPAMVRPDP